MLEPGQLFQCACGKTAPGIKRVSDYTSWYDAPETWYRFFGKPGIPAACSLSCYEKLRGMPLAEFRDEACEFVGRDTDGLVTMPGGLGCPWCKAEANYDHHEYAYCASNHKWRWLPWGG